MKTTKQILLLALFLSFANNNYAQWTLSGVGTPTGRTLYTVGENIYAGTTFGAYRTTNNGQNWNLINNELGSNPDVRDFSINGNKLWAASGNAGVFFSTNGGSNWTLSSLLPSNAGAFGIISENEYIYVASQYEAIYFSTNSGSNWTLTNLPMRGESFAVNGNYIYAAGTQYGVGISTFGSLSWNLINGNLTDVVSFDIQYANNKIYVATDEGVWTSTNNGVNWINIYPSLANTRINCLKVFGNNILIGTSNKIYLSKNDGTSWTDVTTGVTGSSPTIREIASNSTYAFVIIDNGSVYRRPLSDLGIVGIEPISSQVANSFNLSQNYPNPFNPTTNINFSVPKSDFVKMTVYDINGKEISTLVNQEMTPGTYKVDFDGSNLSSGIYYYIMTSKNFVETKKMILLK